LPILKTWIFIALVGMLSPQILLAKIVHMGNEHLVIKIDKEIKASQKQMKKNCRALGQRFLIGKGPLGYGPFKSIACRYGKKHLLGKKKKRHRCVVTM